jgi:hypothetical protein
MPTITNIPTVQITNVMYYTIHVDWIYAEELGTYTDDKNSTNACINLLFLLASSAYDETLKGRNVICILTISSS